MEASGFLGFVKVVQEWGPGGSWHSNTLHRSPVINCSLPNLTYSQLAQVKVGAPGLASQVDNNITESLPMLCISVSQSIHTCSEHRHAAKDEQKYSSN